MKYRNLLLIFIAFALVGNNALLMAADVEENADVAEQAKLKAEYKQALKRVQTERQTAEASIARAHEHLQAVSERSSRQTEQEAAILAAKDAELNSMHEELNRARQQLSETSREIARVNREIARQRSRGSPTQFVSHNLSQPVIGLILGDEKNVGIEVLGVSPDGPSERAGMQQGDVIVAMGGRVLAAEGSDSIRDEVIVAMQDMKATEAVIISVERGDQTLDLSVVPEVREPLTWHSVTRFKSAPASPISPARVTSIERIVVPEIDTRELAAQIEKMRIDIDERTFVMEASQLAVTDREFEFELHEMSEMGDFVLHDANAWFGLPMARGLKLAEVDANLGEYFKTDRGVLVLKAEEDNDLHLVSGDVILQVGETDVNSPADFMRALREFESGQELTMEIKRHRKNELIRAVMPENKTGFHTQHAEKIHQIRVIRSTD